MLRMYVSCRLRESFEGSRRLRESFEGSRGDSTARSRGLASSSGGVSMTAGKRGSFDKGISGSSIWGPSKRDRRQDPTPACCKRHDYVYSPFV